MRYPDDYRQPRPQEAPAPSTGSTAGEKRDGPIAVPEGSEGSYPKQEPRRPFKGLK